MASGSTPLRGRPWPEETDSPDVSSDIHALALSLDTAPVVGQGTLASRPTASVAGNRYYVSGDSTPANNGVEYIDTGSGWIVLPHQPIGSGATWYGSSDPVDPDGVTRWMICDGRAISRTTYAALYAALTTTYGSGDGSTTFCLPDARGKVLGGVGSFTDVDGTTETFARAGVYGEFNHTLSQAEIPAHEHTIGAELVTAHDDSAYSAESGSNIKVTSIGSGATGSIGGNAAHNNLQPTLAVNHIIRVL
jgi:microcystin-dependent protein